MAKYFGRDLLLLERLAAGGMAEVYRAKQLGFGDFQKDVAVKRILATHANKDEFKEMFREEANLSAILQHPNIVQIFGNGEQDGYLFLSMEFVNGKNVRQLLAAADRRKVKIPIEYSCFVVLEAAKGLDYAHNLLDDNTGDDLKIIHRDMSPQNIMLSYDATVKVVDFGIAKANTGREETRAGVLKGKFGYMSPEQAEGLKLDHRTDVFALGVVLFELLTQRRLFTSKDDLRTLKLVQECRVPRPSKYNPNIPQALDKIVMKILSKERKDRYQNSIDVYSDLRRFLNQQYPRFIPTDFAVFLKDIFKDKMIAEKSKRDTQNREARAMAKAFQVNGQNDMTKVSELTQASVHQSAIQSLDPIEEATSVSLSTTNSTQVSKVQNHSLELEEIAESSEPLSKVNVEKKFDIAEVKTKLPVEKNKNEDGVFEFEGDMTFDNKKIEPLAPIIDDEIISIPKPPAPRPYPPSQASHSSDNNLGNDVDRYINSNPSMSNKASKSLEYQADGTRGRGSMIWLLLIVGAFYYFWRNKSDIPLVGQNSQFEKSSLENFRTKVMGRKSNLEKSIEKKYEDLNVDGLGDVSTTSNSIRKKLDRKQRKRLATYKIFPDLKPTIAGYLSLKPINKADQIFIDGQLLLDASREPASTPLNRFRLKPGTYKVKLVNSVFGTEWEKELKIQNDRITEERDFILDE